MSKPGPLKADIVGSLLRPSTLQRARADFALGAVGADQLWEVETKEVDQAVRRLKEIGIHVCTDGEFHRRHWFVDFMERIDGIQFGGGMGTKFHNEDGEVEFSPPMLQVIGKLERSKPLAGEEFRALQPLAKHHGILPKQTIPSPTIIHFRGGRAAISHDAYPDMDEFFADVVRIYREEIADLYAAGCRYIQIDETNLPFLCDSKLHPHVRAIGEDPDKLPAIYTQLINDIVADRPADLTVCMHMCRGNHASSWVAEGGYDRIAEVAFGDMEVDGFFLEFDSPRAGSLGPIRHIRGNKVAVLGLVTTKTARMEPRDELLRRIDEATKFVPLDRLALSPQCGFASTIQGNNLSEQDQWRKLELIVETSRSAWG